VFDENNYYRIRSYRGDNESVPTDSVTGTPIANPITSSDDNIGYNGNNTLSQFTMLHQYPAGSSQTRSLTLNLGDLDNDLSSNEIGSIGYSSYISSFTQPTGAGSVAWADGCEGYAITFTPAVGFVGTAIFTYTLTDGYGRDSQPAPVQIDVTNKAPVAAGQTIGDRNIEYHANADLWYDEVINGHHNAIQGQVSASDADDNTITYSIVEFPRYGEIISFNPTTGEFTYAPYSNFNGFDAFTFSASDGLAESAPASVVIQCSPIPYNAMDYYNLDVDVDMNQTIYTRWPYIDPGRSDGEGHVTRTVTRDATEGIFDVDAYDNFGPWMSYTAGSQVGLDRVEFTVTNGVLTTPRPCTITFHVVDPQVPQPTKIEDHPAIPQFTVSPIEPTHFTPSQANIVHVDGLNVVLDTNTNPEHGKVTLEPYGAFTYTPKDATFRGWESFSFHYVGANYNIYPNWICLRVGLEMPNHLNPVPATVPPTEFPATYAGLVQSYQALTAAFRTVNYQLAAQGQLFKEFDANWMYYSDTEYAVYEDALIDCYDMVQQDYSKYLQCLANAETTAGKYMKDAWASSFLRDVLASPVARFLLIPGPPGTGLLFDAPNSASDVLDLISAFPRDVAGLKPSREQLAKLTKAFNEFGDGAAVLVDHAKLTVTIAEDTQQVAAWTSAIGLTIASGGSAVAAYRAGATGMQILKEAIPFIVATAQTGAVAVDQYAETIAKKLNMSPESAVYLRWGARGVQVICLLYAWRTARMGRPVGAGSNCFVAGTDVATSHGSTAIEYLHPGEQVITDAVQETAGSPATSVGGETAVNAATWRSVSLRSPDPNHPGEYYLMDLLEPLSWIAENHATAGNWVDISIPEMQVFGMAQVTDIETCPPIEAGQGQVILGTFSHISNDVYDLKFVNEDPAIGVTSAHPIWSLDRAGWVGAAALVPGEHVATETGYALVQDVVPDPGEHRVYNIEVEGDHRYLVGDLRVLVHNAGASFGQRVLRPYGKVANPQNVGEELMNEAIDHRLANPELTGGRNLSVVRYRQGGEVVTEVFENVRFGEHSERVAWQALQQKGIGVNDILAWYTERSPCGRYCLPLFQDIKLATDKVFWSADYTLWANKKWFGDLINQVIAKLQN
jgi:hypothetical protein